MESTKAAIKAHNLPESTKAYDSYEKLAADPDVDLYVVSTRADTHYEVAMPALKAGRNVYVEWPLAANTAEAKEMAALAKQKNVKTIIGLQGRISPSVRKVKELIDAGALGEIHSVNYQGAIHVWQNNAASDRYQYFMDRNVGGNLLTIYGGHVLDSILYAVGELKPGSYVPMAANLRPRLHVMKADGSLSEELYDKNTPDQILLQGRLDRNPPAVFSFHLRAGDRFINNPGSTWRIYGTKGELAVEFASAGPQMAKAGSIRFSNAEKGEVEEIIIDEGFVLQEAGGVTGRTSATLAENIGSEILQILFHRGVLIVPEDPLDKVIRENYVGEVIAELKGMLPPNFAEVVLNLEEILDRT